VAGAVDVGALRAETAALRAELVALRAALAERTPPER
jgi:hypothetical protein